MPDCLDLRAGGTLSATGLTGGTSLQQVAHGVTIWDNILSHVGTQQKGTRLVGRPGLYMPTRFQPTERMLTVPILVTGQPLVGETPNVNGTCYELDTNTDRVLGWFSDYGGFYLERDLGDGSSRFIFVRALDAFPVGVVGLNTRQINAVLTADYPWWRSGGNQSSQTVSANTTITNAGNAPVQAVVLSFAGDGAINNATTDERIEIAGSSGTVVVDTLARTVTQGGNPADNLMEHNSDQWFSLRPGSNTIGHTGANVTVTWRAHWNS